MNLETKKCVPCEGGVPRLSKEDAKEYHQEVPSWELNQFDIKKTFPFRNFIEAMKFINAMADLAEEEGHHPDFCVHYNKVEVTIWTHAVGGLTENDFILAAKIEKLI